MNQALQYRSHEIKINKARQLSFVEEFSNREIINLFSDQFMNFAEAVHFNSKSIVPPKRLNAVKIARSYLTKVYSGYKEIPGTSPITRLFSLNDLGKKGFLGRHKLHLVTFQRNATKEEMYSEINSLINQGKILGVADGALTSAFVYSKLLSQDMSKNIFVIPTTLRNKKSPSKEYFRIVLLQRRNTSIFDDWKYVSSIQKSTSVLAFL